MPNPIAHPVPLSDLIDYQPGSVVSRVLLRNAGGVLTLFAFAEGEGLAEHTTPHDAVIQLLEGRLRVTVGSEDHEVATGDVLHLPASVPHALHGGEPFKMLLMMFKAAPTS